VAGRTDRAILREVFARIGIDWHETHIAAVRDAYFERLASELARPRSPNTGDFGVLPGVDQAITAMENDPSFVVGLLTGNFARGAEIKLRHFNLWARFRLGAFGDDHVDRRDLVPLAVEAARKGGVEPARVVIIGDTPLDIDCAHAHGATAVAVATGHYSADELATAGADVVLRTLEDLDVQQLSRASA
jgi:phosphoglycolate phosphatase-like HAD superfamily hydrolase